MNKAFLREPEPDGRAYCPKCQALGMPVGQATLDYHVRDSARNNFRNDGWFCTYPDCDVAYFDLYDRLVLTSDMKHPVYPKNLDAPICACFGFTLEQLDETIEMRSPVAIRELLTQSKSSAANCSILAASGRCCLQEVQRLYIRGVSAAKNE